jgi:hypothetical protein
LAFASDDTMWLLFNVYNALDSSSTIVKNLLESWAFKLLRSDTRLVFSFVVSKTTCLLKGLSSGTISFGAAAVPLSPLRNRSAGSFESPYGYFLDFIGRVVLSRLVDWIL